jgi:hypothetical protein
MRKIIIISFLIFFSCGSTTTKEWSELSNEERKKQLFELGIKNLKKNKTNIAINAFHAAQLFNPNASISEKSRRYVDSLLPILRNDKTNKLNGKWKLSELHYEPIKGCFPNLIEFKNDTIIFYSNDEKSNLKILKKEKINYVEYDSTEIFFEPYEIKFSNDEIWSFSIEKNLFEKNKLYPTLKRTEEGTYPILLDERAIIIDRKKRRKELRKEIYTFYKKNNCTQQCV